MSVYDAILFDFDGVLVDSEPIHFACWNEVLAPFGASIAWDAYCRNCIGVADRAMIQTLCEQFDPPLPFDELWAEYPRKKSIFRDRMVAGDAIAAEVRMLLGELSGYQLAVVTSSGRAEVEPILATTGLLDSFKTVVYGEDVSRLKPAPDPYLLAAERLGAANPLVIEDSQAGIAAGRAAGFDVVEVHSQAEMHRLVREHLGLLRT